MNLNNSIPEEAAPALAQAIDTAKIEFAPRRLLNSVPSSSIIFESIKFISLISIPKIAGVISL